MYHYTNQCAYNQDVYQQCPAIDQSKSHHTQNVIDARNEYDPNLQNVPFAPPINIATATPVLPESEVKTSVKHEKSAKKSAVDTDTSNFSIEERLVAAVWVHERKKTNIGMGQIKQDFRVRFGRAPPARNTLLTWERKLFATGSVRDAPRPGRPINRLQRLEEVSASLRRAPTLSLRARARALALPPSTLRAILLRDLRAPKHAGKSVLAKKRTQPTTKKAAVAAPADGPAPSEPAASEPAYTRLPGVSSELPSH